MAEGRTRWQAPATAVLVAKVAIGTGCVFPSQDATGVEMSWRFVELNEVDLDPQDDQAAPPIRTCLGAFVDRVVVTITDADDDSRTGTFDYPCEDGFQTPDEARTQASNAFLELHPGTYLVDVETVDTSGRIELALNREIDVLSRTLTIEGFDVARPVSPWTLTLLGAQTCAQLEFRLRYANPGEQLGEPPLGDEGEPLTTVLYRQNLTSDRGLSLGGAPLACAPEIEGTHVFAEVDPGDYRLELVRDGQVCAVSVFIDVGPSALVIDLANLTCEG